MEEINDNWQEHLDIINQKITSMWNYIIYNDFTDVQYKILEEKYNNLNIKYKELDEKYNISNESKIVLSKKYDNINIRYQLIKDKYDKYDKYD